ncbi:MAG: hypothetical protein FWF47_06880 [Clostridia bacterium]|nr:hypothetical protein [Clostridia bacterium]
MNHDYFLHSFLPIDELDKSGIKALIIIVNRHDGRKTTKFLREMHFHFQFSCMAQGTSGSEIMDILGLDSIDKTAILCVSPGFHIDKALPQLSEKLHLKKAGRGIAFTIPLIGITLPDISSHIKERSEQWLKNMENEVSKMIETITHSMIISVVNKGYSEELMQAAKAAGAKGGTVINARRTGIEDAVKFFGISLQDEREIVAILTKKESRQAITNAINSSFGIKSEAHGIIFTLPVDSIVGVD